MQWFGLCVHVCSPSSGLSNYYTQVDRQVLITPVLKPVHRVRGEVHFRRAPHDGIRQGAARRRRKRPAQVAVAGIQVQTLNRCFPENGHAVTAHGT